jgi:hypothetical protein
MIFDTAHRYRTQLTQARQQLALPLLCIRGQDAPATANPLSFATGKSDDVPEPAAMPHAENRS